MTTDYTVTVNSSFIRVEYRGTLVEIDRHGYVLVDGTVPMEMMNIALEVYETQFNQK